MAGRGDKRERLETSFLYAQECLLPFSLLLSRVKSFRALLSSMSWPSSLSLTSVIFRAMISNTRLKERRPLGRDCKGIFILIVTS